MPSAELETIYPALRQKERRVYSDEELWHLPEISPEHPHFREWLLRASSAERLKNWFPARTHLKKILEIGCGNGWLSRYLAKLPGKEITGIDINLPEIMQASRVFKAIPNLQFIHGSVDSPGLVQEKFDVIVMAACLQYFESADSIIESCLEKINPNGELHILDTPFYKEPELGAARKRTEEYYRELGFPEMKEHYFHHLFGDLKKFQYRILYSPSFINKVFRLEQNPFPWIVIKKPA